MSAQFRGVGCTPRHARDSLFVCVLGSYMDPPYAKPPSSASVSQVKIAAIHLASLFVVELVHEVGGQIVAVGAR